MRGWKKEGSVEYALPPACDLLPFNFIMPEDKGRFTLAMNEKKTHIRRNGFASLIEERAGVLEG